jgi:hypothetical protein
VFDEVEAAQNKVLVHGELKPAGTFADLKHLKGVKGTNIAAGRGRPVRTSSEVTTRNTFNVCPSVPTRVAVHRHLSLPFAP